MPRFVMPFIAVAAAVLWCVAGTSLLPLNGRALPMVRDGAVTMSVLFGVGMMLRGPLRDQVVRRLADTVVSSRRAAKAAATRRAALTVTAPLRIVR